MGILIDVGKQEYDTHLLLEKLAGLTAEDKILVNAFYELEAFSGEIGIDLIDYNNLGDFIVKWYVLRLKDTAPIGFNDYVDNLEAEKLLNTAKDILEDIHEDSGICSDYDDIPL